MTAGIEPFTVAVPQTDLDDLKRRLVASRWPSDVGNDDWFYGVERTWLEDMVEYWANEFDWRAQERIMNGFPNFRTVIDGAPIHFVHVRGNSPAPTPIVLTHGWPWTWRDWEPVIGPLTDPAAHGGDPADAFDVVIPSLPGFGFSAPLETTQMTFRRVAGMWIELMSRLGYERFAAAGGDFGARITGEVAHVYPDRVLGVYLTLAVVPGAVPMGQRQDYAPDEAWMEKRADEAFPMIISHSTVHRNDPQTLAYALNDSPVGLAAWIWHRRRAWSDCDGDVLRVFDRDFLCSLASIYWLTGTIGSSMRFYKDNAGAQLPAPLDRTPLIPVPTAFGIAPKDVVMMPRARAEAATDLCRWAIFERGGHFGPSEIPEVLVDEYRAFFREL